jgi:biotin operon repressor
MRRDAELRARVARAAAGAGAGGVCSEAIPEALGVSRSTLWRHYEDELQRSERNQP